MLLNADVFITTDTQLENLARRAAQMVKDPTRGRHTVAVLGDADQLAAEIL
jgi:hypothetical protein